MAFSNKMSLTVIMLVGLFVGPVVSVSPWFSSSYTDMHFTLRRFSHCVPMLEPLSSAQLNETQYSAKQILNFLHYVDYEPHQLEGINNLLDQICIKNASAYLVSGYIDVTLYKQSKEVRCQALEDALAFMYPIFKYAAANKSEKLDFSSIIFYSNPENDLENYNLIDLINTAWIQSQVATDIVCEITDTVKDYITNKTKVEDLTTNSVSRRQSSSSFPQLGVISSVFEWLAERLFTIQRRVYWEGTTRFEQLLAGLGEGFNATSRVIGRGFGLIPLTETSSNLNTTVYGIS